MDTIIQLISETELTDVQRIEIAQHLMSGIKVNERNESLMSTLKNLVLMGRIILETNKPTVNLADPEVVNPDTIDPELKK